MIDHPKPFRFTWGKILVLLLVIFVLVGRFWTPLREKQNHWVYTLLNPLISISQSIWRPFDKVLDHYVFLWGAQSENIRLKHENAHLNHQLNILHNQVRSLQKFQQIHEFWQKGPYQLREAQVITFDPVDASQGLWINQGSEQGIQAGQVVIADDAVVGLVAKTEARSAKVIPIISPKFAVDVEVSSTGVRGILRGKEKGMEMDRRYWMTKLEFMGGQELLEVGNQVSTSGLDKVFPRALNVGKIVNVTKDEKGLFVFAEVLPDVDFSKLREVAVLIP